MEFEERHNPLLNRKEIKMKVLETIPPSMGAARKIVSEKFSVGQEACSRQQNRRKIRLKRICYQCKYLWFSIRERKISFKK